MPLADDGHATAASSPPHPVRRSVVMLVPDRVLPGMEDVVADQGDPIAGLHLGEYGRPRTAHAPGIAVHHSQIRANRCGEVGMDRPSAGRTALPAR
jgi:hypothetical protein